MRALLAPVLHRNFLVRLLPTPASLPTTLSSSPTTVPNCKAQPLKSKRFLSHTAGFSSEQDLRTKGLGKEPDDKYAYIRDHYGNAISIRPPLSGER